MNGNDKKEDQLNRLRIWSARVAMICFMFACFATLIATLIVPDVNMIADTISDAAAGKYDFIQDWGLYALALGLFTLAYAMRGNDLDSFTWAASSWCLVIMGIALIVMAYWEGYSPGNSYLTIHYYVVYVFGGAFVSLLLLSSRDLANHNKLWLWINIPFAILWAAVATFFFLMGTGWDGLVERVLGLTQMIWLYLLACKVEQEGDGNHLPSWISPQFLS